MKSLIRFADRVVRYIVWFLVFALGLWVLQMLRGNLFDILMRLWVNPWAIPAITNFFTVIIFLAWFMAVIWLEHYFLAPSTMKVFWLRVGRVSVILLAVLGVSYLLQELL